MNWCLSIFLVIWTIATASSISLLLGELPRDNPVWPVLLALVNLVFWCVACGLWVYSVFARTTYQLGEESLSINTRVLLASWNPEIPRETIVHVRQVKDGGEGEDSFPSWGLEVNSGTIGQSKLRRVLTNDISGSNVRYRSIFRRQPWEQSRWLGIVIARWAAVEIEFCPKED